MEVDISEIPTRLHKVGFKTDALAYMIEQVGNAVSPPERPTDVFYGIGLLLEENSRELKLIANTLEGTSDLENN